MKTRIFYFFAVYPGLSSRTHKPNLPGIPCSLEDQLTLGRNRWEEDPTAQKQMPGIRASAWGGSDVQKQTHLPNFKWLGAIVQRGDAVSILMLDHSNTVHYGFSNAGVHRGRHFNLNRRQDAQRLQRYGFHSLQTEAEGGLAENHKCVYDQTQDTGSTRFPHFQIRGDHGDVVSQFVPIHMTDATTALRVLLALDGFSQFITNIQPLSISLPQFLHKYCRGGYMQYLYRERDTFVYGPPVARPDRHFSRGHRETWSRIQSNIDYFDSTNQNYENNAYRYKRFRLDTGHYCPEAMPPPLQYKPEKNREFIDKLTSFGEVYNQASLATGRISGATGEERVRPITLPENTVNTGEQSEAENIQTVWRPYVENVPITQQQPPENIRAQYTTGVDYSQLEARLAAERASIIRDYH